MAVSNSRSATARFDFRPHPPRRSPLAHPRSVVAAARPFTDASPVHRQPVSVRVIAHDGSTARRRNGPLAYGAKHRSDPRPSALAARRRRSLLGRPPCVDSSTDSATRRTNWRTWTLGAPAPSSRPGRILNEMRREAVESLEEFQTRPPRHRKSTTLAHLSKPLLPEAATA